MSERERETEEYVDRKGTGQSNLQLGFEVAFFVSCSAEKQNKSSTRTLELSKNKQECKIERV